MVLWKVGDKVRLKSGGPMMVVDSVDEKNSSAVVVGCKWYSHKDDEYKYEEFKEQMLEVHK